MRFSGITYDRPYIGSFCNSVSAGVFGGTCVSAGKFIKEKLVNRKLGLLTMAAAMVGSFMGAKISLYTEETVLGILAVMIILER